MVIVKEAESYESWKNREIEIFERSVHYRSKKWNDRDLEEKFFDLIQSANNSRNEKDNLKHKLEDRIKKDEDLITKQQKQIEMLIRELYPDTDHIKKLLDPFAGESKGYKG